MAKDFNLKIITRSIFTPELRRIAGFQYRGLFENALEDGGPLAVSQDFNIEAGDWVNSHQPEALLLNRRESGDSVSLELLHGNDFSLLQKLSAFYFAFFGNRQAVQAAGLTALDLTPGGFREGIQFIALPFGFLLLDSFADTTILERFEERGVQKHNVTSDGIDQSMIDSVATLVLDDDLSAHRTLAALNMMRRVINPIMRFALHSAGPTDHTWRADINMKVTM